MNKLLYRVVHISFVLTLIDNIIPRYIYLAWHLLLGLGFLLLFFEKLRQKEIKKTVNNISVFMISWMIYSLLSLIWTNENLFLFIDSFRLLTIGTMAIIIFTNIFNQEKMFVNILTTLSYTVLFHNIVGWMEYFTGKYLFIANENKKLYSSLRLPTSSFYNTNDFATFLTISIFFMMMLYFLCISKKAKIYYLSLVLSSVLLVNLSKSRANLLGIFIGIIVYIALQILLKNLPTMKNIISRFKLSRKKFLKYIVSMMLVIVLVILINFDTIKLFIDSSVTSTSDTIRMNLIKNGFFFLKESSGLGVGIGNIEYLMKTNFIYPTFEVYLIHNWWMEILVSSGVIVFIAYVSFYIDMIYQGLKTFFETSNSHLQKISGMYLSLLGAFVFSVISTSSLFTRGWFWMMHALIYTTYILLKNGRGEDSENLFRK